MLDIIIRNGRVIDGTGNVWFRSDVGIAGGKIVRMACLKDAAALREIDASGRVVCPGFIDPHTHSEFPLLVNRRAETSIRMGATTHIGGNCGTSAAPWQGGGATAQALAMFGVQADWHSMGQYLDRLDRDGVAINLGTLVGHGTIRGMVMGDDFARPSTDAEIAAMKRLVAEAMEQGALGLSSGLVFTPGRFAEAREVVELCREVARLGGVYATHVRTQGDGYDAALAEAIDIGEQSGAAVELAHTGPMTPHFGESDRVIEAVERARARGVDVTFDIIPTGECVGSLNDMFPPWTMVGGPKEQIQRFRDPALRERIRKELEGSVEWNRNNPALLARERRYDLFGIQQSRDPALVGKTFAEAAAAAGKDPFDFLLDYLIDEGAPRGTLEVAWAQEDLRNLITRPYAMFSSDTWTTTPEPPLGAMGAYPTQYGAFPWVLRHLVREDRLLTLEDAVRKMTSLPAQRFSLRDRGIVREGARADVVVFDPETISDRGSWADPKQYPVGIDYVLVNGQVALDPTGHTGALAGTALRHGQ